MKILLDTNVILDHILAREPYANNVGKLFDMIGKDEVEAAITANSVTDIYYIISKRLGDTAAREALRNLFNLLNIVSIEGNDCISALNMPMADYEDAVVAMCASKDNMDYIVTNDKVFLQADSNITRVIASDDLVKLFFRDAL
jgi:predicted nucleic acid-binding protein